MNKVLLELAKRIGNPLFVLLLLTWSTEAYGQSSADLFNGDVLQEIRLEINPKDWDTLKANPSSNAYYPCNLKWRGLVVENIGVRQRGASTRNRTKPGLRLDFNRYEDNQEFLGLKSLALDNMGQDASMMKERLIMELFSKVGLPAPREVNARFYVNDVYSGLYTLIEPVDKNFLRRVYGQNDGYLYEYQSPTNYHFEYLGSDPALYSPRFFDPKTHEQDPDPAPIEAMIRTMNSASDADFASAMAPYLDLQLFMKHLAVEDFVAETDGILTGMNNFYLYRFEKKNLSQVIVKDKDLTFGGTFNKTNRYASPFLVNASKNVLIRRAMTVPEARDAYFKTLGTVVAIVNTNGWLESEISRIYNQIRTAAYEDTLKLCYDGVVQRPCSNAEFEAEVSANLDFARRRPGFTINQLAQLSTEGFFAINDLGGYSVTKADIAKPVYAGYGVVESDDDSPNPEGIAIFTYRQNGVTVTEASVPATPALQHGVLYAEINGPVKTGLAIANPSDQTAAISFFYTDADGKTFGQGSFFVSARSQMSRFLDEDPFKTGASGKATFTIDSSVPIYVTALRGLTNERSEFIISTLPVANLTTTQGTVIIPHFADGGGWTTQLILVNPSTQSMQGSIQFFDQGNPTSSPYTIAPGSYYRVQTSNSSDTVRTGSVRIVPSGNGSAPTAFGIFSFRKDGFTVSEASLRAVPGATAYRIYVETVANIQTGVALANPSSASITVSLEATTLSGTPAGLSGAVTIPANGQLAAFLGQIPGFERMTTPFRGVLRISTAAASGVAVAGLRGRNNERGDFLVATVPSVDENANTPKTQIAFPHFVEGGGYTTQFILFSGATRLFASGVLRLFDQTGISVNAW
jgi:hypothetical protein